MQFPAVCPEPDDITKVLKQGTSVHTHRRYDCQRQQGDSHHHNPDRSRHGDEKKLRISHSAKKDQRFHSVAGIDHAAQQFS